MLAIERRNEILAKLQEENKVLVSDLSRHYSVTEETIRRDLDKLEKQGLAKKTYGGAVISEGIYTDLPYNIRKETNVKHKKKIAAVVAEMINDGDCIVIDASSTAVYIVKEIKHKKNITLITNSIEILFELSDKKDWKVLSTGGQMREGALSLVGYQAERMIKNFHVDKAIISCKGVDVKNGLTDSLEAEAEIKKYMYQAATMKILAVDNSKLSKTSFAKIDDLSVVDVLVTDGLPSDEFNEYCESKDIEVKFR